ncbi:MAG: MgtC/SapB family protein [Elusimicrobiaceae bacterium]|nr:MgtC/SapB family protein [Elusimicrobiaceae bacterium]
MITLTDAIIRLAVSFVLGAIVGFERQYHEKPAGFSTNTLICMGSTIFALISLMSAQYYGGDPARIAAQIVTGVGFLGAGSIIREGNKISGLTTAAGIWVVAAIGMATGYGEFGIAGFGVLLVLILQVFRRKILSAFESVKTFEYITIKCEPDIQIVTKIEDAIKAEGATVVKSHFYKTEGKLVIKLVTDMSEKTFKTIFKKLLSFKEIISLDR